ncbi:MAG: patatin-like phospholipase family protein [Bacteroidales bacterium]
METPKPKVALVLSGGGARGIAHIGVIEELERRGYRIASIAGTSMGALVGGVYAAGRLDEFKHWILSLDKTRVFSLVDFTLSKQGLIKGDKVLKKMRDYVPDMDIENLHLPYAALAVDIRHNEEVVFDRGSLYDAIRASIAIPLVLTPVRSNGRILVDGGVLNNIPMAHVKRTPGDIMVASYVNADIPLNEAAPTKETIRKQSLYEKKVRDFDLHLETTDAEGKEEKLGYFRLLDRTFETMTLHMAEEKMKKFSPEVLINVSRYWCSVFDFYRAEQLVEAGREAAIETLDLYENSAP